MDRISRLTGDVQFDIHIDIFAADRGLWNDSKANTWGEING